MPATNTVLRLALLIAICLPVGCKTTSGSRNTSRPYSQNNTPTQQHSHQELQGEARLTAMRGPRVDTVRAEPVLRIRIAQAKTSVQVGDAGSVSVGPGSAELGQARTYSFQAPLRIHRDAQGYVLTEPNGNSVRWRLSTISITGNAGRVSIDDHPYPGRLELVVNKDRNGQPTQSFDAVNHVGMEAYLPGVLSQELYASWDAATYRAQAIASRSYAIWEMNLPIRRGSHFDLEAGEASQAYIGDRANDKARAAVLQTAGQVLVFEGRVLPAFYSSCSGGTGQDAVAAWPGKVDDLAPLRGRDLGAWGQNSNRFSWGPVTRDRQTLSRRIAAWGRSEENAVANMGLIRSVQVTATNSVGRPTHVRVTDDRGAAFDLFAEELRMAINFRGTGLPTIDATNMVFSSYAQYTITPTSVTITGRGFGHGVGMCQFGAQHMASQGHSHAAILGFYYPGTRVQRAY